MPLDPAVELAARARTKTQLRGLGFDDEMIQTRIGDDPDGGFAAPTGTLGSLLPTTRIETVVIWAEESAGISGAQNEYSFGNGATGDIGIPIVGSGWELWGVSSQADVNATNSVATLAVRNMAGTDATLYQFVAAYTQTNEGRYTEELATPVALPADCVIGFQTVSVAGGAMSDHRVAAWLRREVAL